MSRSDISSQFLVHFYVVCCVYICETYDGNDTMRDLIVSLVVSGIELMVLIVVCLGGKRCTTFITRLHCQSSMISCSAV